MVYKLPDFNFTSATRKRRVTEPINPYSNINIPQFNEEEEEEDFVQPKRKGNNFLGNLLQAIGTGVGVGLSDDPGKALLQQLSQQQAQQLELLRMQNENEERRRSERQQIRMERLRQSGQKDIVQTEIASRKEEKQLDRQQDILLTDIRFKNDSALQTQHNQAAEKLTQMRQIFEAGEAQKLGDLRKELLQEEIKGDIKSLEIKSIMSALLNATKYKGAAPIGDVMRIVEKLANGVALTKEDTDAIDKSMKVQLMVMGGGGRISSGGGSGGGAFNAAGRTLDKVGFRQLMDNRNDIVKAMVLQSETPALAEDGTIKIDPLTNRPIMRPISPDEIGARIGNALRLYDAAVGLNQEQREVERQATGAGGIIPRNQEFQILSGLRGALDRGESPELLLQQVDSQLKGNPSLQRQARAIIMQKKKIQFGTKLPWQK